MTYLGRICELNDGFTEYEESESESGFGFVKWKWNTALMT